MFVNQRLFLAPDDPPPVERPPNYPPPVQRPPNYPHPPSAIQ